MKEYKKPKIEIIEIKAVDIIQTSGDVITGGTVKFKDEWKTSSSSLSPSAFE